MAPAVVFVPPAPVGLVPPPKFYPFPKMKDPVFFIRLSRMGDVLNSLARLLIIPLPPSCALEKLFELPLFLMVCIRRGDYDKVGLD